jgi:hypothetical protein
LPADEDMNCAPNLLLTRMERITDFIRGLLSMTTTMTTTTTTTTMTTP